MLRMVFLLGVCCLRVAADPTADAVINKVQDRYNRARTLSVHFVENYSLLGHVRPAETGTLTLRKQGKMRWDYSRPEGKLFLSDGRNVYLYTAADNRVEKVPLKDTEDMRAPLAFLLGRLDMKKEFRDFTVRPGDGGVWLEARAKSERTPYESVEMLVAADGAVHALKIMGRDQSVLGYEFTDERLNPPVSEDAFHFTIPRGAEVVDAIEFQGEDK
ncbi:MAG: outer membrane lipoprotein carrier protein LolA [Acidobacteriaceae bacterium]|nr:outer membrane lipoprotein carrier protein LolA [Acidobacteriaceae bacterium]